MPHADELILEARDAERDPGTELFLQDHLRSCPNCRELARKVERADRLIAAPERSTTVPPLRLAATPRSAPGRVALASVVALAVVVGVVFGGVIKTFRESDVTSQVAAPGGPPVPSLPADWQLVTAYDLLIPLPPGWQKTVDTLANSDRPDPDPPRILYFEDPATDRAARAAFVSIWIWPSPSLDALVQERFVRGNLSLVSERSVASWRPMREVMGVASWSGASGAGSYTARHLFVQPDPQRVVDVVVFGPPVPSTATEPTAEMRLIQDLMIRHVVALRDVDRVFSPDQARAAIDRAVALNERPRGSPPVTPSDSVEWSLETRTDSFVRVVSYASAGVRRGAARPDPATLGGDLARITTPRAVGNLVVWASSPDANVRYSMVTALDALLETGAVTSPIASPRLPSTDPEAQCPRTRSLDATSVITVSGSVGIVGDTRMSSAAFNDSFVMVKRGTAVGDRVGVDFFQVGPTRAPASQVSYTVVASARQTPWGDAAFTLSVKPIGFENSCWRLYLDGADTGLVLFVGP